jgi:hypothetical protein
MEQTRGTKGSLSWQKQGLALILLTACGLGAYWAATRSATPSLPHAGLVVKEADLNFGEVWEDAHFHWTIPITNESSQVLQVIDFSTSCICSNVEPRSLVLSPGESKDIRVTIDLTRDPLSQFSRQVTREVAEKVTPKIQGAAVDQPLPWTIRGRAKKAFTVEPRELTFGEILVQGQPPESRELLLESLIPLKTLVANCDPPHLAAVTLEPHPDEDHTYSLLIQPQPNLPEGELNFTVSLEGITETGEPLPVYRVPVDGRVLPDIQISPPDILFGACTLGDTVAETIVLRSWSGKPFIVKQIRGIKDDLTIRPIKDTPSHKEFIFTQVIRSAGNHNRVVQLILEEADGKGSKVIPIRISHLGIPPRE